jgi:adenylyl- and sulfurtransferase ThiI
MKVAILSTIWHKLALLFTNLKFTHMAKKPKVNMKNIYREGNSFRVRFKRRGKTHSRSFTNLNDALAHRLKKIGF